MNKAEIRKICKEKRNSMFIDDVTEKSTMASKLFLSSEIYKNSKYIMLYMPLGNETDTSLILDLALHEGKRVVLPVTDVDNTDIIPCTVSKDTSFKIGSYNIIEPDKNEKVNKTEIDVILVPGIAFGRNGARVGFGKGYYDKFLKGTKAIKVGFCYEFQLFDEIDADIHDIPMDYIVTENSITKISC